MFYIASKIKNAKRWAMLRAQGLPIISTWIDATRGIIPNPYGVNWYRNIMEASHCNALIAFFEPGEDYAGTFIEIGAALAHGHTVYVVGAREDWSFTQHPNVRCVVTLEEALAMLGWDNERLSKVRMV